MSQLLNIVSAVTSSLLASLRFVIALDLALLLFWILGEITYSVWKSDYSPLAILFALTLITVLGLTVWRCLKPQHFGVTAAYNGGLNTLPLTIVDAAVVIAAVFVSDELQKPLTTPVLHFCQTIIHKFTT
jgi:hypothetical protein